MGIDTRELERLEALAERFYTAMYDARRPKDDYEDACIHFQRAIDEARRLGLEDEAARLTRRLHHVSAVYGSQFRGF
ncbi:MAG: hypothetical protein ABSG76_04685 [Xanthobacteraceae bacterium]|jgi:hypothetical protein